MTETATTPSVESAIPPGYSLAWVRQQYQERHKRLSEASYIRRCRAAMRLQTQQAAAHEAQTALEIAREEEQARSAAQAARHLFDEAFAGRISMERIIRAVAEFYDVSRLEIISARRGRYIMLPRHMCCYLAKQLTLLSYPQIARRLNRLEHTSQLHAYRKIQRLVETDEQVAAEVARIVEILERGAQ